MLTQKIEGGMDFLGFLRLLEAWFGMEMAKLYASVPQDGKGILMGCPVWGEQYLDRFENFTLASLKSGANFEALKGRTRLVLFTDNPGLGPLWKMVRLLERQAIDIQLHIIPIEVMAEVPKHMLNKYWALGTAQNVLVQMAGRAGMGFHMLMPDHIYAETYFPNLWRLIEAGHPGIAQTGISANIATAASNLEGYRQPDKSIAVPDLDLGDLGWRHLHQQTRASIMNTGRLPHSHYWLWQGRDALHAYCCHMNAVYIAPEWCAKAETRIPATLDAELPKFMPPNFYVPQVDDGLTFLEISDDTKHADPQPATFEDLAWRCWSTVNFKDDYLPYFQRPCLIPIRAQNSFVPDTDIRAQHQFLLDALIAAKSETAIRLAQQLSEGIRL